MYENKAGKQEKTELGKIFTWKINTYLVPIKKFNTKDASIHHVKKSKIRKVPEMYFNVPPMLGGNLLFEVLFFFM